MNNPTLAHFCEGMIRRADIEESKSNVAMNAWLPQASYPYGNFSDTSAQTCPGCKGSIGHAFTVCNSTEIQNQVSFCPFALREISVLIELTVGHLRYRLTDVPPQPNSPPGAVFGRGGGGQRPATCTRTRPLRTNPPLPNYKKDDWNRGISRSTCVSPL